MSRSESTQRAQIHRVFNAEKCVTSSGIPRIQRALTFSSPSRLFHAVSRVLQRRILVVFPFGMQEG